MKSYKTGKSSFPMPLFGESVLRPVTLGDDQEKWKWTIWQRAAPQGIPFRGTLAPPHSQTLIKFFSFAAPVSSAAMDLSLILYQLWGVWGIYNPISAMFQMWSVHLLKRSEKFEDCTRKKHFHKVALTPI